MFKLPNAPSAAAEVHELADFAELLAWKKGSASTREILAALGRLDDNENNVGCDDDSDTLQEALDEVMNEIDRRQVACGSGYPFALDLEGTVLRHRPDDADPRTFIYYYLLLGTRLNMQNNRTHANIDGTLLLEELSAHVLKNYLGASRAKSTVFGTANQNGFTKKIEELCGMLGEGNCFRPLDPGAVNANDDKLDVVAWVPFSDKKACQLIIFGQCKTGSTWGGQVTHLQPKEFIKRWMDRSYVLDPVRAFCISEAADRSRWHGYSIYAGLFIDRCRLVDFSDNVDARLLKKITKWQKKAKEAAWSN